MPHFQCTACQRGVVSPVVIGAGDCPYCGGDVVFDVERGRDRPAEAEPDTPPEGGRLRLLMRRLRRR
jgi:hypothetical protein